MNNKIKITIYLISSFLLGTILTLLFWISLASFFEININIILLIFLIMVSVFTLQSNTILVSTCNIVSYILGILLSSVIELNMDLIHILFECRDIKMSAGDGFGVYIYSPIYMCAIVIVIVLTAITTFVRIFAYKMRSNGVKFIKRNKE